MAQAVLELIAKTEGWTGGIKRAQTGLTNFIKTHGGLHQALAQDNQTMAQAIKKFGDFESKAATVAGRLRETESAFMEWGMMYKQMTAQERATPAGKATLEQLNKLAPKIREMKSQMKDLQGQLSAGGGVGFGKQLMTQLIPGFGMGMGAMAAMETVKALRAFKDVAVDTVKVNMEFEQSNANLAAILGKTREEVVMLTENAKALGGSTKFTASEITKLQTVLSRRGLREDQILDMTHGIANLSIATGTDLAQSAELAASTMQAFGMKATEMERIVSVLGVSTTKSALTTEALGTSLQYVAPAARAAGFSLEDTVAILGTLVNNGINASTAGTSLRQIMLSMGTEGGKLAKALGGPVKSFDELVAALQRLKNEGGNSLESVGKAVRVTALPAFLALVNSADGLNELRESITGVEGELQKMADTQMDTAKGAKIIFESAKEGLKLTFDESNGMMKSYYEFLTKIVNKWKEHNALINGGQSAVNILIGDQDSFQKRKMEEAKHWVQNWEHEQQYLTMNGIDATDRTIAPDWDVEGLKTPYSLKNSSAISGIPNIVTKSTYANAYDAAEARLKELNKQYKELEALSRRLSGTEQYKGGNRQVQERNEEYDNIISRIGELTGGAANDKKSLIDYLKQQYEEIVKMQEVVKLRPSTETIAPSGVAGDETSGSDIIESIKSLGKGKSPAEKAEEMVANALRKYEQSIELATTEYQKGVIDEQQWFRKKISAQEQVYRAYDEAYAEYADPKYKESRNAWMDALVSTTNNLGELNRDLDELKECAKKNAEEMKRQAAEQKAMVNADKSIYSQMKSAVGRSGWDRIAQDGGDLNARFAAMKVQLDEGVEIPNDVWEDFVKDLNEKLLSLKLAPIQLDIEAGTVNKMANTVKDVAKQWGYVTQAVTSVGSALQSIEDPSAKISGIIATAVASTALGFAQASTADSKYGTLAWIAAAAAGLANMTAMIASIKQVTAEYHADGGFVGGGAFQPKGSDTLPCMLTPGELVLNRAQQNSLAAQLAPARGYGDLHMEKIITGEDIRIVLTNNARRRGGTGKNYAI